MKDLFEDLIADEPAMRLHVSPVMDAGRAELRARRVRRISGYGLPALALGAAAVLIPTSLSPGKHAAAPSAGASTPGHTATQLTSYSQALEAFKSDDEKVLGATERDMAKALKEQAPSGYTFKWTGSRTGDGTLDGIANDGTASGAFYLSVKPEAAYTDQFPCTSWTSIYGGTCTMSTLGGAEVETIAYPAKDATDFRAEEIVIQRPEGGYVVISASNAIFDEQLTAKDGTKYTRVTNTGSDLLFTHDQLITIAKAVEDTLHR